MGPLGLGLPGTWYRVAGVSVELSCVELSTSPPGWESRVICFSGTQSGLKGALPSGCFCLGLFSMQTIASCHALGFNFPKLLTQSPENTFLILTSSFKGFIPLGHSVAELRELMLSCGYVGEKLWEMSIAWGCSSRQGTCNC